MDGNHDLDVILQRRGRPFVDCVAIDGELLVWVHETEELHRLDATASLILALCDGQRTLGDIVEAAAATFQADASVIAADVVTCVERFVDLALVTD